MINYLPVNTEADITPIADLVNTIVELKERNPLNDTTTLETKIDRLVYELYGLTYDEVLIVDPETPITREEYNNFKF